MFDCQHSCCLEKYFLVQVFHSFIQSFIESFIHLVIVFLHLFNLTFLKLLLLLLLLLLLPLLLLLLLLLVPSVSCSDNKIEWHKPSLWPPHATLSTIVFFFVLSFFFFIFFLHFCEGKRRLIIWGIPYKSQCALIL